MRAQLIVARQIARNLRATRRAPDAADLASGSEFSPAAAAAYADTAFRSLAEHGGLTPEVLSGARVLEVGPGENLALGLRLVAAGAQEVVAIDRFAVHAGAERQSAVYRELIARLDGGERARAAALLRDGGAPPLDPTRVRLESGLAAEDAGAALEAQGFDIAVSIAALQHTADLGSTLRSLDRLLAPGGLMAHQVDFGDMGIFSGRGMHPLSFLTVSDRRYRWMGSNLGIPNRALIDSYRTLLEGMGYAVELKVTKLLGDSDKLDPYRSALGAGRDFGPRHIALVDEARPRLLERYRSLPVEDLLAHSALVVAQKPDRG